MEGSEEHTKRTYWILRNQGKKTEKAQIRKSKCHRRNNINTNNNDLKIMYANCRGVKGKVASLREVVGEINPDIIVLNETFLRNNEEISIKGYKPYNNTRESKLGGGIEIMVKQGMEQNTVKTSEGVEGIEEMTIRVETKKRALNVISLYGKTQGRVSNEKINKEQFTYLHEHKHRKHGRRLYCGWRPEC